MRTFGSVLLVVLFLVAGTAQSQIIFSETFDYSKMGGLVDCSLMNLTSPYAPLARLYG